ncbi:MAG: SDR family oxidoreductase [Lachnospiraceae bacterium]|nr:SDR family oxidoreductase [Lachnospiraceae bacterium]
MKRAVVTGASSGIGAAIAAMLLEEGYEVYGIARHFRSDEGGSVVFHKIEFDLTNTSALEGLVRKILSEGEVDLLVNNAGVGYYGPHEEISPAKLHELVAVNLEAPMILTSLFLRSLKKTRGCVIDISSVTAGRINTHGCAYGATKAGLSSFGESLFEEVRKHGVSVVTIEPDMTRTDLYRNSNFRESDEEDAHLEPWEVAEACRSVIKARPGLVFTKIALRPQTHRINRKSPSAT